MRRLTLRELNEQYGGVLPPDAVLRADDDEETPSPRRPSRPAPASRDRPGGKDRPKKGTKAPMRKLIGYRRFFDWLDKTTEKPSVDAVTLWAWLWTAADARLRTRASERRLADRFGIARDTVRSRLVELMNLGLIVRIRRGRHGRHASIYHVRCRPNRPTA